jgi:XTP/dITP diphosphohydrolase
VDAVLASRNRAKLAEMQALLSELGFALWPVSDFAADAPEETAPTFVENALLKARHASRVSGMPAIADDSGIEVDALQGRPGVRSARFAGDNASDADNNALLLKLLDGVPWALRGARFVCAMVFLRHADDPVPLIAQAAWSGHILEAPRGANGFGYDPLFCVGGRDCSSAELPAAEKNRLSHRAQAAAELKRRLTAAR